MSAPTSLRVMCNDRSDSGESEPCCWQSSRHGKDHMQQCDPLCFGVPWRTFPWEKHLDLLPDDCSSPTDRQHNRRTMTCRTLKIMSCQSGSAAVAHSPMRVMHEAPKNSSIAKNITSHLPGVPSAAFPAHRTAERVMWLYDLHCKQNRPRHTAWRMLSASDTDLTASSSAARRPGFCQSRAQ